MSIMIPMIQYTSLQIKIVNYFDLFKIHKVFDIYTL